MPDFVDPFARERYFKTSRLLEYFAPDLIIGVRRSTVSRLCEITSGSSLIILSRLFSLPLKSGISVSNVIP